MSNFFKVLYGILFLALLLQPHIIKGHVAGLDAPYLQSLITMIIVGAAVLVYLLHTRDAKDKQRLKEEQTKTVRHLTDLSAELGLANRRLPLLHVLTTDVLKQVDNSRKQKQTLMQQLLATLVVSLSQSEWGVFRFVDVKQGRTVGEFIFANERTPPASIVGNKILLQLPQGDQVGQGESQPYHIIPTTDQTAPVKCHYIIPRTPATEHHYSTIQNIVDQAQIMYKYLYQ